MSRKNTMLGLAALAALGFAATSFAQCPSSPVPPWSSVTALSGSVEIVSGGYDGTSCRLDTSLTGALGFASAFVRDDTPADEPTYRAQFLVDVDNLTSYGISDVVRLFAATTEAPAQGVAELVRMTLFGDFGGTNKVLGVSTACADNPSGRCSTSATLSGTGVHRIEIAWEQGAAGGVRVWVNNTDEGSPTTSVSANNVAWGGVDAAVLGLSGASTSFLANHLNKTVGFDEFDSRRTTFIGN